MWFFFLMIRRPPRSTPFPNTTLFRADEAADTLAKFDELGTPEPFVVFLEPPSLDERIVNQFALFSMMSSAKARLDRKSTRLNSSHANISYAVFCLKKKNTSVSCICLI